MKKQIHVICLVMATLLLVVTCKDSLTGPESPTGELPRQLTDSEQQLIEADQQFSYKLFRETVSWDQENENVFISPLSVSMALSMTLNGARGKTFEDMRETLAFSDMELEEINESFQSLVELLVTADPAVQLKIANSIWYREGFPISTEFQENMKEFFDARIEGLDFSDP
ncbi:MAG: serpin family protein, partial [Balneolaceae bacterium]|nr:serpin family protein [Balneolaceae bacterium]